MDDQIAPPSPATTALSQAQFVAWLREVAPYVHSHRGRTFVVAFEGELIESGRFSLPVAQTFPLAEVAEAHRVSEQGHVRGKLVLLVG